MKYLFAVCASLLLIGCSPRNEHYYQTHPQALEEAIESCPAKQTTPLSCDQLATIAASVNDFAKQLRFDPQSFGRKILALEQTIASQEAELKSKADQPELKTALAKNKLLLEQYIAVVGWLESPES